MIIQEAITSGRSFKRKEWIYWSAIYDDEIFIEDSCSKIFLKTSDILADDWVVKQ
jgi:hypothetical protein